MGVHPHVLALTPRRAEGARRFLPLRAPEIVPSVPKPRCGPDTMRRPDPSLLFLLFLAALTLLLLPGCSSNRAESVPGQYYVVPSIRATKWASLGTWPSRAPALSGAWALTEEAVSRAERGFARSLPVPIDEYHRQYAGLIAGGRRWVFLHAQIRSYVKEGEEGALVPLHWPHGGRARAWGALFDPELEEIGYSTVGNPPGILDGLPTLAQFGERAFDAWSCGACHSVAPDEPQETLSEWLAIAQGPSMWGWAGSERSQEGESAVLADESHFITSVLHPSAAVSAGYPDEMPSYEGMIDEEVLDALWGYVACLSELTATSRSAGVRR